MGQSLKPVEKTYGSLLVLHRVNVEGKTNAYYQCRCVCGKEWPVSGGALRKGQKSCGCQPQGYNKLRPYESLYNWLKAHSSRYGKFDGLTYEEFLEIIKNNKCHYCGDEVKWAEYSHRQNGSHLNLDRIDSSKGYNKDNVVVCCWPCNTLKSDMNQLEFLNQVAKISKHQKIQLGDR